MDFHHHIPNLSWGFIQCWRTEVTYVTRVKLTGDILTTRFGPQRRSLTSGPPSLHSTTQNVSGCSLTFHRNVFLLLSLSRRSNTLSYLWSFLWGSWIEHDIGFTSRPCLTQSPHSWLTWRYWTFWPYQVCTAWQELDLAFLCQAQS